MTDSRAARPDVSKFNGFMEKDVQAWLDNFELVCKACRVDPAASFPNHTHAKITLRLRQKGASFDEKGWTNLRKSIEETYGRPINKVQLQLALNTRRQAAEETVSQFADALDEIAIKLKIKLDELTGIFVAGLQDHIADGGMKCRNFDRFEDALAMARTIEENVEARRPKAATQLFPVQPVAMAADRDDSQEGEEERIGRRWTSQLASAIQRQQQPYKSQQQFRNRGQVQTANPQRPHDRKPYDRPLSRYNMGQCDFCGFSNHEEKDCRLKRRVDNRRKQSGLPLLLAVHTNQPSHGPAMLTDAISIGDTRLTALIDTGATGSFIRASAIEKLKFCESGPVSSTRYFGGNGLPVEHEGTITSTVSVHNSLPTFHQVFLISRSLPFDIILGTDALAESGMIIDPANRRLLLPGAISIPVAAPKSCVLEIDSVASIDTASAQELLDSEEGSPETYLSADVLEGTETSGDEFQVNAKLNPRQRQMILDLLGEHERIFKPASGLEPCHFPPFTVDTGDHQPIYRQPFRIAHSEREAVRAHVQKYLERGWIVPSSSSWASPTLIVRRNGKERFCVDYRAINQITVPDRFPPPNVQDCIDKLSRCQFFTLCDADAAYHQCRLADEDAHKLAFATHDGLFQPTVVLFGPRNAPAYFQRNIAATLTGINHVQAYLDDIMIATETWDEHISTLKQVLSRLEERNIRLKRSKCSFAMDSVKYLGFIVNHQGVHPDAEKIKSITELSEPTSTKGLRSFLGMCAYYSHFVNGFSQLAKPLFDLTKKGAIWKWTSVERAAFEHLREAIAAGPMLRVPDLSKPFELLTDASGTALGAVLQQRDNEDKPFPVAFASRVLLPAETRYFVQELECLAVVFGLLKFRVYLLGRHFKLYTDHKALMSVLYKPSPSARITRWSLTMQEFDFEIIHIPGSMHFVPDALSRAERQHLATIITDTSSWKHAQLQDPFCASTLRHILFAKEQGEDSLSGFKVSESELLVLSQPNQRDRIVVPDALKSEILKHAHDEPISGHLGRAKTFARLAPNFFWPGWRRDTADYVSGCKSCQQRKGNFSRPKANLHVLSQGPNDLVAMDIQGPLVTSQRGNSYILVIQDIYTKYVTASPLADTSAENVAHTFVADWIRYFGAPARLLTDNGANFSASSTEDICNLLKIQKIWTSPYHPQTDGSVERFNRTLNEMLSHYVNHEQDDWDDFLPLVVFAYNSAYHTTVKNTPYLLMLGRPAPSAADLLLHTPGGFSSKAGENARRALKTAMKIVYGQNILRQRENSDKTSLKELTDPLDIGESVLLFEFSTPAGLKAKYRRRWTGPFKISNITGPLSYIVTDGVKTYRANREHLKRVYNSKINTDQSWPLTDQLPYRQPKQQAQTALGVSSEASSPSHQAAKLPKPSIPASPSRPKREQRTKPARYRDES